MTCIKVSPLSFEPKTLISRAARHAPNPAMYDGGKLEMNPKEPIEVIGVVSRVTKAKIDERAVSAYDR